MLPSEARCSIALSYLPGAPAANAPETVQDGAVFTYLGSENIYQPNMPFPLEEPVQSAGPVQMADFDHQTAAIVQDRLTLPHRIRLHGRRAIYIVARLQT